MKNKGLRNILLIGIIMTLIFVIISGMLYGWRAVVLTLIYSVIIFGTFLFYTNQRYRELGHINVYLSKVLAGDYDLDIQKNEEGELSMLQNNIYKATVLLREKNELLEKEKIYLADMLANISHQLKTPLTSMMMMNELMYREESEEKRREFIAIEEKQLDKMNWLIQNLLKLSKIDAGTIQLKSEEVPAKLLIEESLSPFLLQLDVGEIVLEKRINEAVLNIDREWTVEALRNIIKNCIEHMSEGGRLEITCTENNLYHLITVRDNGCGIDEEDLPHIFERFYRGKSSGRESVGIGLSLSKSIIEKQRGTITASSRINEGTYFEIRFYKAII